MSVEELIKQIPLMIVAWILTPIALVLLVIDIFTNWLFEDQYRYQTDLYGAFGRFLGRIVG
jgi:hypothetical protein